MNLSIKNNNIITNFLFINENVVTRNLQSYKKPTPKLKEPVPIKWWRHQPYQTFVAIFSSDLKKGHIPKLNVNPEINSITILNYIECKPGMDIHSPQPPRHLENSFD